MIAFKIALNAFIHKNDKDKEISLSILRLNNNKDISFFSSSGIFIFNFVIIN